MLIGNATSNEAGALHDGEPGNQRKLKEQLQNITDNNLNDELKIQLWQNLNSEDRDSSRRRPLKWVFRFKNLDHRRKMAQAMINACRNPYIGYDDSSRRTSLWRKVAMKGYSVEGIASVDEVCDCDCSSLVALCFFCATGNNSLGSSPTTSPGSLETLIRNTGLCEELTVNPQMEQFGEGLIPGDICIWRSTGSGHATVVVNESDDVSVLYNSENIPWISGVTGVVIVGNKKVYGQTKNRSVKNSTSAFRIYALDESNNLQEIIKVVSTDKFGNPNYIYGYSKINFGFNLIGDSRTVQLGSISTERNTTQNALLYGFFPDKNIFAWWGCRLVELNNHTITKNIVSVKGIVSHSSYSDRDDGFTIWLENGQNDKAFHIIGACAGAGLDTTQYTAEDALVGKSITVGGYVEQELGQYFMQSFDKFFSPSPNTYSCPVISVIEDPQSSTGPGYTIDQLIVLMNNSSNVHKKFNLSQKAKDLVMAASQSDLISACFWFGINDVQIYKDAFLGNLGETSDYYVKSYVEEYYRLVKMYLEMCGDFNNSENNIFITSIVSTSTKEKDYYPEQGQIIKKINDSIQDLVEIEQNNYQIQTQGGTSSSWGQQGQKTQCWLQYVELNLDGAGNVLDDVQKFVSDADFRDNIHFTRQWFKDKYLPVFGFTENAETVGEAQPNVYADYSALAPKDWPCSSRDINWYLQTYPRKILDWFVSRKFSPAFAIGIIANMRGESYFCPWICGDYSKDYNVSSKLWIRVNGVGVPGAGTGNWFEPGGYSDFSWRDGGPQGDGRFSRVYRTQNEDRPSSFGFCQWHNRTWDITYPNIGDWQSNGIPMSIKKTYGKQIGRGANMMNFCENLASYKAPWSANPIGQLEYLLTELPSYPAVWELRYCNSSMRDARHVADVFCRTFEMPPEVDARATERANRAEGYWNWLIMGGAFFGG